MSIDQDLLETIIPENKPSAYDPLDNQSKFEICDVLGRGGMGTVYDANDRNIRRKVAVKCISEERAEDEISRKYFLKEAQITGQLEHPNIIPIHEVGVNPQGLYYYVMKRVEGSNLADILDWIKAGEEYYVRNFTLGRLITIFQKILDAVNYAHSRGVLHLDLKPENIMVGDFGEVLLLDWGIARLRNRSPNVNSDFFVSLDEQFNLGPEFEREQVIGSPAFMAPEQATGKSDEVGTRTDIYSLGAILYNILTLRPPVAGKSTTVMIKKIVSGGVRAPLVFNEQNNLPEDKKVDLSHISDGMIPESLSRICMHAMSEKQENRYQSVQDFQNDLNSYLSGYVICHETGNLSKKRSLFWDKNKYLIVVVTLLVLINIILAALMLTGTS